MGSKRVLLLYQFALGKVYVKSSLICLRVSYKLIAHFIAHASNFVHDFIRLQASAFTLQLSNA